jgi:hypothetical protein
VLSPPRYTKKGVAVRIDGIDPRDHEDTEIGSKGQVGPIQVIVGYEINHFFMIESACTISGFPLGGGSNKMLVTSTFIIHWVTFPAVVVMVEESLASSHAVLVS